MIDFDVMYRLLPKPRDRLLSVYHLLLNSIYILLLERIPLTVRAALLAAPLISRPPTKKMLIFGFYSIFKPRFYQEKCVLERLIVARVR